MQKGSLSFRYLTILPHFDIKFQPISLSKRSHVLMTVADEKQTLLTNLNRHFNLR